MSNPLQHRSAAEISAAIVAGLKSAQWADAPGEAAEAFNEVEAYDSLDLPRALSELVVAKGRVALVVTGDERWETQIRDNPEMAPVMRRRTTVTVLVSDRVIGNRVAAIWGDETHPGCRLLADIAVGCTVGPLFAEAPLAEALVTSVARADVSERETTPGRTAMAVEFEVFSPWYGIA